MQFGDRVDRLASLADEVLVPESRQAVSGGVSSVRLVRGGRVALKRVQSELEGILLGLVQHPNVRLLLWRTADEQILRLLEIIPDDPFSLLVTPFYARPLAALFDMGVTSSVALPLVAQIVESVTHLHSRNIAHRDLSPNNFMLHRTGRIVLIDFGLACRVSPTAFGATGNDIWAEDDPISRNPIVGTGPYRAPEIIFSSTSYHSLQIDLWSLGSIIAQFFTARAPSSSAQETLFCSTEGSFQLIGSIFRLLGTPTAASWPESRDLKDFSRFTFEDFPRRPLQSVLPGLPHGYEGSVILGMLEGLLRYNSEERRSARETREMMLGIESEVSGDAEWGSELAGEEGRRLIAWVEAGFGDDEG